MDDLLRARLVELRDRLVPDAMKGPLPVNEAMIRNWREAVEGFGATTDGLADGGAAPPAMLHSWIMAGLRPAEGFKASPLAVLIDALNHEGFVGVVATDYEQEYERPVYPGEDLWFTNTVPDISEMKMTKLGEGYFLTQISEIRGEDGSTVGRTTMKVLKYRPAQRAATAPAPVAGEIPRPTVSHDTRFYWEGTRRGQLLVQRCANCGERRHPPSPTCPRCLSFDWTAEPVVGAGRVYSYTVHHYPPMPGHTLPLAIALVELDEGIRLISNLLDVDPDKIEIGMGVELMFERLDDEFALPQFRPLRDLHAR